MAMREACVLLWCEAGAQQQKDQKDWKEDQEVWDSAVGSRASGMDGKRLKPVHDSIWSTETV